MNKEENNVNEDTSIYEDDFLDNDDELIEKLEKEIQEEEDKDENPYYLTSDLKEKEFESDTTGIYIPYTYKNPEKPDERDIYLKIYRQESDKISLKYIFVEKKNNGNFKELQGFIRKKPITEEIVEFKYDKEDNLKESSGTSEIRQKISNAGIGSGVDRTEGIFVEFWEDLKESIIKSECLDILKKEDYEFKQIETESESIDDIIEERSNPTLSEEDKKTYNGVAQKIMDNGLIEYLEELINPFHVGDNINIIRKMITGFNIMRGKGSYLSVTTAKAGRGKSLEDEIAFLKLIPEEYVFKANSMTSSGMLGLTKLDGRFFDRNIIYFGDRGSEKSFEKLQELLDIVKVLITEGEYFNIKSEKINGNWESVTQELIVDTIGGVIQSPSTDFIEGDGQIESRTIKSTPIDPTQREENKIQDMLLESKFSKSRLNQKREEANKEIAKFQIYLKGLVKKDFEVVCCWGNVLKRFSKNAEVPIRELSILNDLFEGYCILTLEDCDKIQTENDDKIFISSEKQIQGFMKSVCLENALAPLHYNFLKMMMGKGNKQITLIDEEIHENEEGIEKPSPLRSYYNSAIYDFKESETLDGIEDLEKWKQERVIGKLMKKYRLRGRSSDHEERVFFTKNDISGMYGNNKGFTDIPKDELYNVLSSLENKGYVGKLPFKDGQYNIYYLTTKCSMINDEFEITVEDLNYKDNFLYNIGVIDKI